MTRWVLGRAIDEVGREWNHDASHVRETIDTSPRAVWLVTPVALLLAAAMIGGIALAAPAAAEVSDQPPIFQPLWLN